MRNVIIVDEKDLERKKRAVRKSGLDNFHVVSDFDRTLTKAFVDGEKTPSLISELRTRDYINEQYSAEAQKLADFYHPIEIDPVIPLEEKKRKMYEWWVKHFELLIKSGLNRNHLAKIIESGKVQFRKGVLKFLDFLNSKNIPLIIISSSGLGSDSIRMFLQKYDRDYSNIHIISNEYQWDQDGNATEVKEPIIHCMNKDESVVNNSIFGNLRKQLQQRRNVLLLGDNPEDIGMITGFDYIELIKLGFLNENVEQNLERYRRNYDVVLVNDTTFNFVNKLIRDIK